MLRLLVIFFPAWLVFPVGSNAQCNDPSPYCPAPPSGPDVCYYDGLISPPVNITVYVGQTAVFSSQTLPQCFLRAYFNDCKVQDDRCLFASFNESSYLNCTISNAQLSDDGTKIDMYIFSSFNSINCYDTVFLTVIGPPSSPDNLTIVQYCNDIIINGSWSEDTTEVYIEIMTQDNDTTFNITKSTFPVNISVAVFEDHHILYKVIVYNKNPAGLSQPYEMDLLLFKSIFDINSSSLQIINNKILMTITIQVNISCPLSVPQQFNLSSNCINNNFYQVINGTTIDESGLIDLSVIFYPNKRNCTVTVSSGDHELYIINQNTYEIQEVIISENTSTGYFSINCAFLPGSQTKGCAIEVVNDTGDFLFSQNINRLSSTSLYAVDNSSTCLTNNGTYTIYVYIWDKYGRINKSLEVVRRPLTVISGCKKDFSTSVTMTTNPPTLVTPLPTASTPLWSVIVSCFVSGSILLIVVLVLLLDIPYWIKFKKKNNLKFEHPTMYYSDGHFGIIFPGDDSETSLLNETTNGDNERDDSEGLGFYNENNICVEHLSDSNLEVTSAIFGELTVLEVTTSGLVHHCSQYGVTLIIPEGAIEHTAIVWFGVCLFSDKFKFEDDYIPVSPIVWIYINCQLIKPAELYIPHHIDVSNMEDINNQLYLLTADDESFRSDKIFTFKQNHEYQVTIESTLVKVLTPHFCSNCIATKGSTYKEIPKKYLIAQADKRENDTLFVEFSFLHRQKGCMKMLEEQCIREGYHQSSYSPVKFTGSGRVSITLDPDSILGWDWSYYGVNYDFISEDSINYFKVMGCEDGEVTSDDIEMLDLLEHKCSYPPRFRLKFEPDKIAYNIRSHNVTVTFNNVTPPTTATITLPGNGQLSFPSLSPPLTPDPGCFSKKTDPLFGDILHVITNKNHLKEKWFNFGYELGLRPGQLHNIETKYYESLQCTREVLLQWRVINCDKPLDPLVDALCKIGLIDIAVHIKYHFINPEQQSREELYDVYHHLYDKYHVISSQTVSSVNGDPSGIFQVHSAILCNAIEADPLRIVNSLIADKLLVSHVRNDVTSMNGTSYDKANKIVGELQRQIVANDNPVQFLRQVCDVLISQKDITLSNIGVKMMNLLTSDHHNKISSTSDNTHDHNTCKPKLPLVSNLSTKSDQQLMEEPDDVYCSLCNKHHSVHSQTTSPAYTCPLPDVSNHSCTEETRIESSITNLKEELLSTHQQQHIFSPVKEAEMETQDLLNKPSKISSEELSQQEDLDVLDVPLTDLENKISPFFIVKTSQYEQSSDTVM